MTFAMKKYKYGICITTYNRPNYLSSFINTLKDTEFLNNTVIRILDDNSNNSKTLHLINNLPSFSDKVTLHFERNEKNLGPAFNYTENIKKFIDDDVDYIINLDADCILNKKWLKKINFINNCFGPNVISSVFWCDHGYPTEEVIINDETFLKTRSLNGICLCFPKYFIDDFMNKKTSRSFDGFVSYDLKHKYNLDTITTEISYLEHIGIKGVNYPPDVAKQFIGL